MPKQVTIFVVNFLGKKNAEAFHAPVIDVVYFDLWVKNSIAHIARLLGSLKIIAGKISASYL